MATQTSAPKSGKKAAQNLRRPTGKDYVQLLQKIHIWEVLAFLLSFLLIGFGFYKAEMHPFGDRQFLVTDLWHQYYPFFQLLHEKLTEGGSMLYTWRIGLGTNFLALLSYYAASPLNLLAFFMPQDELRTGMMVILMLKFACAGGFMSMCLRYVFGKNDISITAFGVMYALCSYMVGYYWNTIWIDTVALLPLIMLGLTALVREGKWRVYAISLAIALMSSYYIGYMVCIYIVITFFLLCLFYGTKGKVFFKRVGLVTGISVLSGGLVSFVLLPAFFAMLLTHSADNTFPTALKWYEAWKDVIANMMPYTDVTAKEGLPNLYCGFLPLLLLGPFVVAKKIRIREKVAGILLLVFLIVSCNMNYLNFIWHGFHVPNMLPYRFAFLFSFTLLIVGYRAYTIMVEEKLSLIQWGAMILVGAIFLWVGYTSGLQTDDHKFVKASAIIGGVYLVILFLRMFTPKQIVHVLLSVAVIAEMGIQSVNGVKTVGSSGYSIYPANKEEIAYLLDVEDQQDDSMFSRTEITQWYTLNDPALYYYNGVSMFSSMTDESITKFMRLIGISAGEASNRYFYANNSPFNNMLLNVKYIIAKDGYNADTLNARKLDDSGSSAIWEENLNLGIGFLVETPTEFYIMDETVNAFQQQNGMFRKMTGLTKDIFTPIDITHVGHSGYDVTRRAYGDYSFTRQDDAPVDNSFLKYNYTAVQDGMLYALVKVTDAENVDVWYNNAIIHTYNVSRQPYTFPLGYYHAGEMVTLKVPMKEEYKSGTAQMFVYQLNEDVLLEGYERLKAGQLQLTEFEDTHFKGTVTADKDKILFMSVPYDKGWKVYVDGKEEKLYPIFDAMSAVNLTAGEHEIEMRYSPRGFVPGICISIVSLAALVMLYILERKKSGKPVFEPAESSEAASETSQEA